MKIENVGEDLPPDGGAVAIDSRVGGIAYKRETAEVSIREMCSDSGIDLLSVSESSNYICEDIPRRARAGRQLPLCVFECGRALQEGGGRRRCIGKHKEDVLDR